MARTKSVQSIKDEPPELDARIVNAIRLVGPKNITLLARMTGAPAETVRYKVKTRLRTLGFRFHAEVDYGKLGLSLHWATLHFSPGYYNAAPELLRGLNQFGYLTYFAKIVPQGHYVALFALPEGVTKQYRGVLSHLKRQGVLTDSRLDEVLVSRHNSMDPRFFNFQARRWEVDWTRIKESPSVPLQADRREGNSRVDYYDLLLIKELQMDALQHLVATGRKLKVNEKTIAHHYRTHVLRQKLVRSYIVRWMQDTEKTLAHSVLTARLTFRGLSQNEHAKVQRVVNRIPLLWAEDLLNDGTYIATLCVPVEDLLPMLGYLNSELADLNSRVEFGYVKPRESSLFTIPYYMFKDGRWAFDPDQLKLQLRQLTKSHPEK